MAKLNNFVKNHLWWSRGSSGKLPLVSNREFEQGVDPVQIKFGADVGAMMIHGARTDKEYGGEIRELLFADAVDAAVTTDPKLPLASSRI